MYIAQAMHLVGSPSPALQRVPAEARWSMGAKEQMQKVKTKKTAFLMNTPFGSKGK
jgi:hypothetical protein